MDEIVHLLLECKVIWRCDLRNGITEHIYFELETVNIDRIFEELKQNSSLKTFSVDRQFRWPEFQEQLAEVLANHNTSLVGSLVKIQPRLILLL